MASTLMRAGRQRLRLLSMGVLVVAAASATGCRTAAAPEQAAPPFDLSVELERPAAGGVAIVSVVAVTGEDRVRFDCSGRPSISIRGPDRMTLTYPEVCFTPFPNPGTAPGSRIPSRFEFSGLWRDANHHSVPAPPGLYTALVSIDATVPNCTPSIFLGSIQKIVTFTWP